MTDSTKLSSAEFTLMCIEAGAEGSRSKGIHTLFSGYNEAYRAYFDGADPIEAVDKLTEEGVIDSRRAKKGRMIYKKGEMPATTVDKAGNLLAAVTLKAKA